MYFIPESKLEQSKQDSIDYFDMAKRNLLTICPGNEVDYSMVVEWYVYLCQKYHIKIFKEGHDRWNAKSFVNEMDDYGFDTEKVTQDYETLSTPMKILEADLKSGIVNYNQNPIDIYCLKNTACSVDKLARIMPKKMLDNANKRIDGAVTMIMCYAMLDRYKREYMEYVNR